MDDLCGRLFFGLLLLSYAEKLPVVDFMYMGL